MVTRDNIVIMFKLATALAVGSYVYLYLSPAPKGH